MAPSTPIYKQIRAYLEDLILQNAENPNYKLPSENQISLKFGSSRIPAKRALDDLAEEGRIYRIQGKGSMICQDNVPLRQSAKSVCLFVPNVNYRYTNDIISGISRFFKSVNIDLYITLTNNDSQMEEQMIYSALDKHYSGFIILPVTHHTYNDALLKLVLRRFPVVFVGRSLPGLNISSVGCDHYLQAYNITQYLIDKGHREIGFISEYASSSPSYDDRMNGYRNCILKNFTQNALHYFEIDFFSTADQTDFDNLIHDEIKKCLWDNPSLTAIITTNNALHHIYTHLISQNVPPDKIDIAVFDRPEYLMMSDYKPIIVDQQPVEIGYRAAQQLFEQIKENCSPQNITVDYQIVCQN